MFKILTTLAMAVIGLLVNAQVSENRKISSFSKIEITDGVELIYTQSDETAMKIEAPDGLGLSSLDTKIEDGTLKISCKGNLCETIKVYVKSAGLLSMKASRDSKITLAAPIHTRDFTVALASNATFYGIVKAEGKAVLKSRSDAVFNIRVESATLEGYFNSGSRVNLSGISGKVMLRTAGNSLCNARNLIAGKINVQANDTASVIINAATETDVDVADNAQVKYFGSPKKMSINPDAIANAGQRLIVTKN